MQILLSRAAFIPPQNIPSQLLYFGFYSPGLVSFWLCSMCRIFVGQILIYTLFGLSSSAAGQDTFSVYFPLNAAQLDSKISAHLDSLVFRNLLRHGQKLTILGFADYLGGNRYNDSLSLLRAKGIREHLVASGFTDADIIVCIGKGKIERPHSDNHGYSADRKVQIIADRRFPVESQPRQRIRDISQLCLEELEVDDVIPMDHLVYGGGYRFYLIQAATIFTSSGISMMSRIT